MSATNQANPEIEINQQQATATATQSVTINVSSSRCCHYSWCSKYEYAYLKNETCCYCLGIRIAMLLLCVMCISDGMVALFAGPFILGLFDSTPGTAVSMVDMIVGVVGIIFGSYGFFGTWKMNEKVLRLFYYAAIFVLVLIVICDSLLVILFFIDAIEAPSGTQKITDEVMIALFFSDMISGVAIWGYCVYKIRQFYLLVFSHYHQLSDNANPKQKQSDNTARI